MAKPSKAFQMPVEDEDLTSAKSTEPASVPAQVTPAQASGSTSRPTYRQDKRNLSVWIDKKAFNSFKAMVAEEGTTIQDYVVKMINQEFAKKGRPLIAKQ